MSPNEIAHWVIEIPVVAAILTTLTSRGRTFIKRFFKVIRIIENELTDNGGDSTRDMVKEAKTQSAANHEILESLQHTVEGVQESTERAHGRIDHLHDRMDILISGRGWQSQ